MSRHRSQIPRLKPASSYGNLAKFSSRNNLTTKSTNDLSKISSDNVTNRKSMIDAPIPVTHRRMCGQYQLTKPPWATDDTIDPFDRRMDFGKPKRAISNHQINRNAPPPELQFSRADSPVLSMYNYMEDANNHLYCDNESVYRSEISRFVTPTHVTATEGIQTDLTAADFTPRVYSAPKSVISNQDKRFVVPPKELKRNDQKNNSTYRIHQRNPPTKDVLDFGVINNDNEKKINNRSDKEMQDRIDYWLKKSVELQKNNAKDDSSPDSQKPQFRNQITFTPRKNRAHNDTNGYRESMNPHTTNPTSPQTIEAIIIYSDSGSEKDNVVSSRSLESRSPKLKSLCKIQADLSPRTKSPMRNEAPDNNNNNENQMCDICSQEIRSMYMINSNGLRCHRECFVCFLCKKRLSLENYKINSNKLCCPIHFRLTGN